ncbi:MAG: DUF3341 domain-containing protein [Acetobacteraceae bacterium]
MSHLILAEFRDATTLLDAARRARDAGMRPIDAHTPFKVEGMEEALGLPGSWIRPAMLIAGLGMAVTAFLVQWYSAVINYPLNIGGRPLNSWQTFLIPCFELGVLAAGFTGFFGTLYASGLPRPHQPIFGAQGFERASQDRFFLSVADPDVDTERMARLLDGLGPLDLRKVET